MSARATILWLEEISQEDIEAVGGKGANLGEMARAGFPVPPGFCVTTAIYHRFLAENGLEGTIHRILALAQRGEEEKLEWEAKGLRERIIAGKWDRSITKEIVAAYHHLAKRGPFQGSVIVRSSATAEDVPRASFAGQGETYLNVTRVEDLLARIAACWASLWSPRAVLYRQRHWGESAEAAMAVVIQTMIPAEVSGVAFSLDPLTGEEVIVIEAVWGLGEALVSGEVESDRYTVDKGTVREVGPIIVGDKAVKRVPQIDGGTIQVDVPQEERRQRVLLPAQVEELAATVLALEGHFEKPIDIEWGLLNGKPYLFQARPVTVPPTGYFTTLIPDDRYLWTGGFLSERFARPVSPLGWSIIGGWVEELGLLDPLRFMGVPHADEWPITKLYRGYPFANVAVFQTIYKPFPEFLLPDDAFRYFPEGDTSYRKRVPYPCSLFDPRLWFSFLQAFVRDPWNWSIWHNHRRWSRFLDELERGMEDISHRLHRLRWASGRACLDEAWQVFEEVQRLSRELLTIHRLSLTHADLSYTLLRKWVAARVRGEEGERVCAHLVAGLPNKSVELDRELSKLAEMAPGGEDLSSPFDATQSTDSEGTEGERFAMAFRAFLERYGHRSFTLDIYYPPFAAEPDQVLNMIERLREGKGVDFDRRVEEREEAYRLVRAALAGGPFGWLRWLAFKHLLGLARRYMVLREDQRFHWQRALAAAREAFLWIGGRLAAEGELESPEDIFFATIHEVEAYVRRQERFPRQLVMARKAEYCRLLREHELAPQRAYPPFLKGNWPLDVPSESVMEEKVRLKGQPVSPGLVKGKVKVVISPQQFAKIEAGDILVTLGADPGWTPLFGRISGLILERGGQLSHGAILAREYGLPAVAGITGATRLLHDGEAVLLDGFGGEVTKLDEG